MTALRAPRSSGKVRPARLTDLAALGELSRLCQADCGRDPIARACRSTAADRRLQPLPAAARGVPPARPAVRLRGARPMAGLVRVEREAVRDEWTIVELDAVGHGRRRRHPLPARPAAPARRRQARRRALPRRLRRRGRERGAVHAGRLRALRRGADPVPRRRTTACPPPWTDERARGRGIRPTCGARRLALARLYATATPAPVARLEAIRLADWERQGPHWRVPRSCLTPILRFADVEAFVQAAPDGGTRRHAARRVPPGRRGQGGPAPLPQGHRPARGRLADLIDFGLGVIAARTSRAATIGRDRGVIAPVRTYESPIDRRLEETASPRSPR